MRTWFNLFRWPNLVLIFVAHLLFRVSFLKGLGVDVALNDLDFFLLSLSIILVTAGGNVINDIFDVKSDSINNRSRPIAQGKIKTSSAFLAYIVLNTSAIFLCFYISYSLNLWSPFVVEIIVILLLYWYARYLKSIPVLGNVLVSILVSLSFVLVLYYDMNKALFFEQKYFSWILFYSVFAFWTNLNREWIKDALDIKGDYAQHSLTIPILIGKSRTNILIFASTLLLITTLLFGVKVYLKTSLFFSLYFIFGVVVPLLAVLYKIGKDETQVNYKTLSRIYKIAMLTGVFSLILFKL